jgi:hypothetical protein
LKKIIKVLFLISMLVFLFSACSKGTKTADVTTESGYIKLNGEYDISISLDKPEYKEGDTIIVKVQGGDWSKDSTAWIGIIPSDIEHGKEVVNDDNDIEFHYPTDMTNGKIEFTAPVPGNYDMRINSSDVENGIEIGYLSFVVK